MFINEALFVEHDNDGGFVGRLFEILGLLFHQFVAVKHAENIDHNIPLIIER